MRRSFLLIFFASFFFSFQSSPPLPTKLRITIIDGLGNIVEGAKVSIYTSDSNYLGSTNAVATEVTDEKGRVVFKKLAPMQYYVEATKGEMNNNGEGVVTSKLKEGRINRGNIVIE